MKSAFVRDTLSWQLWQRLHVTRMWHSLDILYVHVSQGLFVGSAVLILHRFCPIGSVVIGSLLFGCTVSLCDRCVGFNSRKKYARLLLHQLSDCNLQFSCAIMHWSVGSCTTDVDCRSIVLAQILSVSRC